MHWKICKEFGIEAKEQWYEHEPKAITEKDSVMILWDMPIHTDRTIAANRPDITLKSKKDKTCLLIDMTIPLDTPGGGHFRNFWVGMCRWDPGTLDLYQS